jgi:hypothetical protein
VNTFIKRNSHVTSLMSKPIESARIKDTQEAKIIQFYNRFNFIREEHNIQQRDIWNRNKHGITLGVYANRIVLGGCNTKKCHTYIQSPENREWISIIETISATGESIRLLVIFKGKNLQTSWFSEENLPALHQHLNAGPQTTSHYTD